MERQNSQGSSIASERIAAVVPVERRQQEPKKVIDVEDAENFEESLRASVECLRAKMTRLMETAPSGEYDLSSQSWHQLGLLGYIDVLLYSAMAIWRRWSMRPEPCRSVLPPRQFAAQQNYGWHNIVFWFRACQIQSCAWDWRPRLLIWSFTKLVYYKIVR